MNAYNNTNKRATESFIVAKPLGATTAVETGYLSDSFNNLSGTKVNLLPGQIAFMNVTNANTSLGMFQFAGTDLATLGNQFRIVQGTQFSQDPQAALSKLPYPLVPRTYEQTNVIDARENITVTRQQFRSAAFHTVEITLAAVTDETEYSLFVRPISHRNRIFSSSQQNGGMWVSNVTPDFSANAAYTNPIDWLVQHTVRDINRNSIVAGNFGRLAGKAPMVAIPLTTQGTAPGAVLISSIAVGTAVPIYSQNGVVKTIIVDQILKDALVAATATHIAGIDLVNAGKAAGSLAEAFVVIGMDARKVFSDAIPQVKTRVDVTLLNGFTDADTAVVVGKMDEGEGYGHQLLQLYKNTQGQRKYTNKHIQDPVIEYPSDIDPNIPYDMYIIQHGNTRQVDTANLSLSPYVEYILFPRYLDGAVTNNPYRSTFQTRINDWLSANNKPPVISI
jgi:hypothetical protein